MREGRRVKERIKVGKGKENGEPLKEGMRMRGIEGE